jgi:hypothetical protein
MAIAPHRKFTERVCIKRETHLLIALGLRLMTILPVPADQRSPTVHQAFTSTDENLRMSARKRQQQWCVFYLRALSETRSSDRHSNLEFIFNGVKGWWR